METAAAKEKTIEVPVDFMFNYLMDLKKKSIDPVERARLLNEFCKKMGWSHRELGKQMNVPHSTVDDWLMYTKISSEEVKTMKTNGLSDRDIYRTLRNNKKEPKDEWLMKTDLDYALEDVCKTLGKFSANMNPKTTPKTTGLISEAKDKLNRILMHIEQKSKS